MKIYLKTINADARTINKWTWNNDGTEKTVFLTDNTNLLYPTLCLDYDAGVLTSGANYVYIPDFGRYYFISGMQCDNGKRIYINCSIDVLNTYKTGILNAPVNVLRSQSAGIGFFADSKLPIEPDRTQKHMEPLASPFTKTAGGYRVVVGVFNAR